MFNICCILQVAEVLLCYGSAINAQDHNGNAPLHFCSSNGHVNCTELLSSRGALLNIQNHRGDTALHSAARWGYIEIVRVLIRQGAAISITNQRRKTPIQEAQSDEIKEVLSASFFPSSVVAKKGAQVYATNGMIKCQS